MSGDDKVTEHPFENVVLLPPKPGVCPVCAYNHNPRLPHNKNSLYYQMRFRHENGRFPTWNDAMAHCTDAVKALFVEECRRFGYDIAEEPDGNG